MLKQRVITAVVLAPIVICAVLFLEPFGFSLFVAFVLTVAAWEWANMAGIRQGYAQYLYAAGVALTIGIVSLISPTVVMFIGAVWWLMASLLIKRYPEASDTWSTVWKKCLIGLLVLVPTWSALSFLRTYQLPGHNDLSPLWLVIYPLLIVWAADIGAYAVGKQIGKRKLAPQVSPGKSWEGAIGGLSTAVLLALCAVWLLEESTTFLVGLILLSVFAAAFSIVGDLTESMFKRQRGIKDSSQLLPGHGGVLDRIDGLTAALPMFAFALIVFGELI